jgi:hypothetical protein
MAIARDMMGLQVLHPAIRKETVIICPYLLKRLAVCATEMIIVPKSVDEAFRASFANKAYEIGEDLLRQPESKIASPEVFLPLPLHPSLRTRVEEFVREWFEVKVHTVGTR